MDRQVAHWQEQKDRLCRTFKFAGFADAIAFMNRCAFEAEAIDHHPEWQNIYNRVEVELTTHDSDGLTQKDYDLAEKFNEIFEKFS